MDALSKETLDNLLTLVNALVETSRIGKQTITIEADAYTLHPGKSPIVFPWVKTYASKRGQMPRLFRSLCGRGFYLWIIRDGVIMVYPNDIYDRVKP